MKTQRKKFEDWAIARGYETHKDCECNYANEVTFSFWQVWQAAIESVVVELPESHQDEWKELNLSVAEVKKALDDAGVKFVLPETFVRY